MPATTNKQRLIHQVFTVLGKGYKHEEPPSRPVLDQFLYAICREGMTRAQADDAFRRLQEMFFDWNEVRVSSARELADALEGMPDAEARGQRLIDFLQEVFETTFSFDLETLHKKGLKQAAKQLARYQAANDYAVAWVVKHSLAGHAIPLDEASLRVLRRLGIVEEDEGDLDTLRAGLEHQVPKAKGSLFCDLISLLADEHCWDDDPNCVTCPLGNACPTGMEARAAALASTGKKPR